MKDGIEKMSVSYNTPDKYTLPKVYLRDTYGRIARITIYNLAIQLLVIVSSEVFEFDDARTKNTGMYPLSNTTLWMI